MKFNLNHKERGYVAIILVSFLIMMIAWTGVRMYSPKKVVQSKPPTEFKLTVENGADALRRANGEIDNVCYDYDSSTWMVHFPSDVYKRDPDENWQGVGGWYKLINHDFIVVKENKTVFTTAIYLPDLIHIFPVTDGLECYAK